MNRLNDLVGFLFIVGGITAMLEEERRAKAYQRMPPRQRERYDRAGRRLVSLRHQERELRRARAILRGEDEWPWEAMDSVRLYQPPRGTAALISDLATPITGVVREAQGTN